MAKYCGNCGAKLEDSDKICGQCGMLVNNELLNLSGVKNIDKAEKRKKIKKNLRWTAFFIVFIAISVIVGSLFWQFTGYNGLLRKVMNAYERYDIDTLILLSSDLYYYGNEDFAENYYEDRVGADLDLFEQSVGLNYKISYKINDVYDLPERRLNEILDMLESSNIGYDAAQIERIAVSDITVTAEQGNKSIVQDINIFLTKEDGTWKLLAIE